MCCHYAVRARKEDLKLLIHNFFVKTHRHESIPTCDYGRFFVDKIPIRVFKNFGLEATYPTQEMKVIGTIWNAKDWAGKIDWSKAPFTAHFQGFGIDACVVPDVPLVYRGCYYNQGTALWTRNETLTARQMMRYQNVRRKYLDYDYCMDRTRYPDPFPECHSPIGV